MESFPVGIIPFTKDQIKPLSERKYDVCFVGTITPRRKKILDELESLGALLSPKKGVNLEDAALESRIVLNIHARKSNHLEIPRILGGFAAGSAVVTEDCYGMSDFFLAGTYLSYEYSELSVNLIKLLDNIEELKRRAYQGNKWLESNYLKYSDVAWMELLRNLEQNFILKNTHLAYQQ